MLVEQRRATEALQAETVVFLHGRMRLLMRTEVAAIGEATAALQTVEGFLAWRGHK